MKFKLVEEVEEKPSSNTTPEEAIMNGILNDLQDRFMFLKNYAISLEAKISSTNTTLNGKLNPQVQAYKTAVEEMEDIAEKIADILAKRGR